MKYIIMAGGNYKDQFETPKPLLEIDGEKLIERTIRLLRKNNITDIAISTNIDVYNYLGVEILQQEHEYIHDNPETNLKSNGCWLNAYYLMDEPCCYLHGDVYWSEEAINKIVNAKVENTMFICIPDRQDGRSGYNIKGREPLGYKVQNNKMFNDAVNEMKKMIDEGKFKKDPISWHLYRKLNNIKMVFDGFGNDIFHTKGDYITIEDYTTDIDMPRDIPKIEKYLKLMRGELDMVKVEVIEGFTLGDYQKLQNIVRKGVDIPGGLFVGDVFECDEDMAKYLTGGNKLNKVVVKVLEVIPKEDISPKDTKAESEKIIPLDEENLKTIAEQVNKAVKKTTKKKTSKK